MKVYLLHVSEVHYQLLQALLASLGDVRAHERGHRGLDDSVHLGVDGEPIVGAHHLAAQQRLRLHRLGDLHLAAQTGQCLGAPDVLAPQAALHLARDAALQYRRAELAHAVEILGRHVAVFLLDQHREGVGQHVVYVLDADHLSAPRSRSNHSRTLTGSSNQYSLSIGTSS